MSDERPILDSGKLLLMVAQIECSSTPPTDERELGFLAEVRGLCARNDRIVLLEADLRRLIRLASQAEVV
jgi:hypothetical protein